MAEKIEQLKVMVPFILAALVAFNMILAASHKALDKVVHMTASKADDKIWNVIGFLAKWSKKIIDIVGMNPEHK